VSGPAARAVARLVGWWFAPAPASRLAALRIVTGGFAVAYLALRLRHLQSYVRLPVDDFAPVGIVRLLGAPPADALVLALPIASLVLAIGFTLGVRHRVVGPAFAAVLWWVLTYRNSWGMIFHTDNLLVLHVAILGCAPAADAWSLDARGRAVPSDDARYGWPVRLLGAVMCATYVVAGVAKLVEGGGAWLTGQPLRDVIARDNLRKVLLGSHASPLARWVLGAVWPYAALAWATMLVELGAPLALLGRRWAAAWAATAWGFHLGVWALMAIFFPYPLGGVAFAALFPLERPVERWLARRRGQKLPRTPSDGTIGSSSIASRSEKSKL
jgi:hypothetical protein